MRKKSFKKYISLMVLSMSFTALTAHAAFADDGAVPSCAPEYKAQVDKVEEHLEYRIGPAILIGGAAASISTSAYLAASVTTPLIAVSGVLFTYSIVDGIITLHRIHGLEDVEFSLNAARGDSDADGKVLQKLLKKFDKNHNYSLQELKNAVLAVDESGNLCEAGKLASKKNFEKLVAQQLSSESAESDSGISK